MRPQLAVNEQTVEFLDFLTGSVEGAGKVNAFEQLVRRLSLHASMRLMPEWAQRLTGLYHSDLAQQLYFEPTTRLNAALLRWAFGVPAYRALADARVAARAPAQRAAHAEPKRSRPAGVRAKHRTPSTGAHVIH